MKNISFIIAVLAILLGGFLFFRADEARAPGKDLSDTKDTDTWESEDLVTYFTKKIQEKVIVEIGHPKEGFRPALIQQAYSGATDFDFIDVAAMQGMYQIENEELIFVPIEEESIHTAAQAITKEGMKTLLQNIAARNSLPIATSQDIDTILFVITAETELVLDNIQDNQTISSPFTVEGSAPGTWYFEAVFDVRVQDAEGNVLVQAPAFAKGEWMTTDMVPFESVLDFEVVSGTKGMIVFTEDITGLEEQGKEPVSISVPVVFE